MIYYMFLFVFGLVIGSFLNVCIYRLPREESVINPPSHCTACGAFLKPMDMVPVLSYLLLRGCCRFCGARFSARYALVELLTGGLFIWCFSVVGQETLLAKALIFTAFMVVITFIDYDHQLILDKVLLWFASIGALINLLPQFAVWVMPRLELHHLIFFPHVVWLDMLLGTLVGGGLMLLIAIVSRGGMGGGDIKFAAALGLWFGWKLTLLILLLAFVIGGVSGVVLMGLRIKKRKDYIPFGPFITIAAFIGLLYGQVILTWYLGGLR